MEQNFKIPSVETHFPREKCAEGSFRTDLFCKPAEEGKPAHRVRLIWCCPEGKYNPKTGRCEDAIQLHKLIREEAAPGECSSSDISEIKERLSVLESRLKELMDMIRRSPPRTRERTKYDCEDILKRGEECRLEPREKRAFVMCYLQKGLREGTIKDKSEGMRKGWEILRRCTS